jgi:hypothetical protein
MDRVDQSIHDIAHAIGELFRLFSHLGFIMGSLVTLSTPIPVLPGNSGVEERACTFI